MTTPTFDTPTTNPFGLTDVGSFATPTLADIDNDGDLDAFVGNNLGNTFYYQNTGNASNPSFGSSTTNPFGLTNVGSFATPTFADIDNDGDLDAFVGNRGGNTLYYQNTGSASNPSFGSPQTNPFGLTNVGAYAAPTLADIDGDGDLDAFVGEFVGNTLYYQNTGNASNPSFGSPQTNPFGLTDVGFLAKPTFADIDGDGDLDAFVGSNYGNTLYYQNTGSASNPSFASPTENPFGLTDVGAYAAPTFADIDGDGDLDAFVGEFDGDTFYYQNTTPIPNQPPVATDDTATTDEDTTITVDVLSNDTDADSDPLTVTEVNGSAVTEGTPVTLASGATLTLNANGTFSYNPNGSFESLNVGDTDTDSFTYTVSDGTDTDTATVTLTIDGVNDGPTPTSGNDNLIYTNAVETIDALAGNDTIRAQGGNDDVFGNDGNDRLLGENGNDTLDGGAGNDVLNGGKNNDLLVGGSGNDWLEGDLGNDTLIGVDDSLTNPGAGERDVLRGNSGVDLFVLGDAETVFYDDDGTTLALGNVGRAIIREFDIGVDKIQLHGAAGDYRLIATAAGNTNIYENTGSVRELIGVVEGTTGLSLSSSSQFTFV
jgi:VCBS repeat-containing protein